MALQRLPAKVLIVAGPTASGKSELAAALAARLDGEIVGADSRQVYRYLDVGTAKPEPHLRVRAPHHLIDVVEPDEDYDVARYRRDAFAALAAIESRDRRAIVCGGTGLYLRSLSRGLFAGPPADPELRSRLLAEEGSAPGTLHARLRRVDAVSGARIHANDLVRTVRALEVFETSGRPLSSWLAEHGLSERPFETLILESSIDTGELRRRIDARSRRMVAEGLVDELEGLYAQGYDPSLRAFDTIGYREAAMVLAGTLARGALAESISRATAQYAKRQRTWLRGQAKTVCVTAGDVAGALRLASGFFS